MGPCRRPFPTALGIEAPPPRWRESFPFSPENWRPKRKRKKLHSFREEKEVHPLGKEGLFLNGKERTRLPPPPPVQDQRELSSFCSWKKIPPPWEPLFPPHEGKWKRNFFFFFLFPPTFFSPDELSPLSGFFLRAQGW